MGRHACPGKWFASYEIKLILTNLLSKFDTKLKEGDSQPRNFIFQTMNNPNPAAEMPFRTRGALFEAGTGLGVISNFCTGCVWEYQRNGLDLVWIVWGFMNGKGSDSIWIQSQWLFWGGRYKDDLLYLTFLFFPPKSLPEGPYFNLNTVAQVSEIVHRNVSASAVS